MFHQNRDDFPFGFMRDDRLAQLEPNLPAGIRLLEKDLGEVSCLFIWHMLYVWHADLHVESVQNLWNADQCAKFTKKAKVAICRIKAINLTDSGLEVIGAGYFYHERIDPDTGRALLIPYGDAPARIPVERQWLDAHHPGWQERLTFAQDLEMDLGEKIQAVKGTPGIGASAVLPGDLVP